MWYVKSWNPKEKKEEHRRHACMEDYQVREIYKKRGWTITLMIKEY